jgi:hypothetical protein
VNGNRSYNPRPLEELDITLAMASRHCGTLWRHKSGQLYQITSVSIRESDNELLYTYRPADRSPPIFFTRPASEWNVPAEGDSEPRFTPYVYN